MPIKKAINNDFIDNMCADIVAKDSNMSTETSKEASDNVVGGRHQEFSAFFTPLILLLRQQATILENF